MSGNWRKIKRPLVLTDDIRVVPMTLLAQAGLSLVLAVGLWFWHGSVAAMSLFIGGMVAVVPNAFLAARLFGPASTNAAALMRSAWIGEIGKLALTAVLFGAIFALLRPVSAPAVFAGFIAAQLVIFGALLLGSGAGHVRATTKS
jgi:ATP synthase protein I